MEPAQKASRTLDLPNVVTLVRVPLALAVWLRPTSPAWVLSLMAAAAISDLLDGACARWMRSRATRGDAPPRSHAAERVGSWLDPACDKLFVLSAVLVATVCHASPWPLPVLPLLLLTREIVMVPMVIAHRVSRDRAHRVDYTAEAVGKVTTVLQLGALVAWILGHPAMTWLAIGAAVLGLATAIVYLRRGHREVRSGRAQSTESPSAPTQPSTALNPASGRSEKVPMAPKIT